MKVRAAYANWIQETSRESKEEFEKSIVTNFHQVNPREPVYDGKKLPEYFATIYHFHGVRSCDQCDRMFRLRIVQFLQ